MHKFNRIKAIVFRVDASIIIGSGHVMRCLTLADQIYQHGMEVYFICRSMPGNMCDLIQDKGYKVYQLSYNELSLDHTADGGTICPRGDWQADTTQMVDILNEINTTHIIKWLIVDHYELDKKWEQQMRMFVDKIMVIDDLADRQHDCDLLLDQNLYMDMNTRYTGLIPQGCQLLLGPEYALLRQEFYDVKQEARIRGNTVRRILIFFGGSDPTNETAKALHALQLLNRKDIFVDVIVGKINIYKAQIRKICATMPNTTFYCQVNNMAILMNEADLAIGAGGSTTWERAFLGLPALIITIAENQIETTEAVAKMGAIVNLGWYEAVSSKDIYENLLNLFGFSEKITNMSKKSFSLSSKGCCMSVIKHLK